MTFYAQLDGDSRKAYEDSIGVIWAEAQRQLSLAEEDLVLRDLLASEDFKLATETWRLPIVTATGFTTWINNTIDDTRFIAVYGFAMAGWSFVSDTIAVSTGAANLAGITLLRITRGGKQLRVWQVEPYLKNVTAPATAGRTYYSYYADDPVTVFQNIPFKVEIFSPSSAPFASATPVLPLLGKVAEPEGKLINR